MSNIISNAHFILRGSSCSRQPLARETPVDTMEHGTWRTDCAETANCVVWSAAGMLAAPQAGSRLRPYQLHSRPPAARRAPCVSRLCQTVSWIYSQVPEMCIK